MMASNTTSPTGKFTTASENGLTPANVIVVGAVMPALAFAAVFLRFLSRRKLAKRLGPDDIAILVALILTLGLGLMLIVGSALGGLARPTPQGNSRNAYLYTTNDAEIVTEKIFWAFNLLQCLAFGAVKASVLLFYRQIFKGKVFNVLTIIMLAVVGTWSFAFFFAILFRCGTNFWALWAPLLDLIRNCYVSTPMFLAFSISDVLTDVIILVIPVYWVMKLNMLFSKRLAVAGIFALGFAAVAAGALRLAIFVKQTKNPYLNADGIGHLTNEIWYSMIEMGISVVAACLPTLRPLFRSIPTEQFRSFFSLFSSDSSQKPVGKLQTKSAWTATQKANKSHYATSSENISMERMPAVTASNNKPQGSMRGIES